MTPDEARAQARTLLQSTDALLGGLLVIATQLREAVAIFSATIDQTEQPRQHFMREVRTEPILPRTNGHLTLAELHSQLNLAGITLAKDTLNAYASLGKIPCKRDGKHRVFIWKEVLDALNSMRKNKRNEVVGTQENVD